MKRNQRGPIDVLIVAVPETAGSALYGLVDVLSAAGVIWQTLVRTSDERQLFRVRIVSTRRTSFSCGNGIPVRPAVAIADDPSAPIIILPELWLGPDEPLHGRYPALIEWLRRRYLAGSSLYSACSGSVMLAETGLLDGRHATSHWGYQDLFRRSYPDVRFDPAPNLAYADAGGRIVTAGGTTSWHDLALHIIARHASPGEALRIAKVYLLKWHDEGDLPFASLVRNQPHADSVARRCENWLKENFREVEAVSQVVSVGKLPERTHQAALQGSHRQLADRVPAEPAHRGSEATAGIGLACRGRDQRRGGLLRRVVLPPPVQEADRPLTQPVPTHVSRLRVKALDTSPHRPAPGTCRHARRGPPPQSSSPLFFSFFSCSISPRRCSAALNIPVASVLDRPRA